METVTSADGTTIAFERFGRGPALVTASGAFCDRRSTAPLAEHLGDRFTVYRFDRRGRGDSGDTPPWSVAREVEDLTAVIIATGEAPLLYGHSSGAALALETAERMAAVCAEGQPEEAARLFLHNTGMGDAQLAELEGQPWWPRMVSLAPQLSYDVALGNRGEVPVQRLAHIECPVLAMAGGLSPGWATDGAASIAAAVSDGRSRIVDGAHHGVDQGLLAGLLADFFAA